MQNHNLADTTSESEVAEHTTHSPVTEGYRREAIYAEQIRLLFSNAPMALAAHLFNGLITAAILWDIVPKTVVMAWIAALMLISGARLLLVLSYRAHPEAISSPRRWATLHRLGSLLAGILWACAGLMALFFTDQVAYHAFAGFVLAGMCAGAIATNAMLLPSYTIFLLPAMLPFVGALLTFNDKIHFLMAVLSMVFITLMHIASRHFSETMIKAVRLSLEKTELASGLNAIKQRMERSNTALETEIRERRQTEQALVESEKQLRSLADSTSAAIFVMHDRIIYANPAASFLSGYAEKELRQRAFVELVHPDFREQILAHAKAAIAEDATNSIEVIIERSDGTQRWCQLTLAPLSFGGSRVILGTGIDITERKKAQDAVVIEKELAEITLRSIGDAVITTDPDGLVNYFNPVAEQMTGWSIAEARGLPLMRVMNLIDESTRKSLPDPVTDCLRNGCAMNISGNSLLLKRGVYSEYSIAITAAPIRDGNDAVTGCVIVMRDLTEVRGMARQLSYQASHDSLTALINRQEFEKRVGVAVEQARSEDTQHAIMYLDLDHFKSINDTCGRSGGDEMLAGLADNLNRFLRDSDVLARFCSDEFGILVNNCPLQQAVQIAEELCQLVRRYRFSWEHKDHETSVSIGVIPITKDSPDLPELLGSVDAARQVAKQLGGNRVHLYREDDTAVAQHQGELHWLHVIRRALEDNRFILYQQAIVPTADDSGRSRHIELLIRMLTEDGEEILPMAFIPAAERYHLMPRIDRWVVENALSILSEHPETFNDTGFVAINLSGQSLGDAGFLDFTREALIKSGIQPNRICFEVTETAAVENIEMANKFMRELGAMGCRFALDDFGSGLSSFGHLKNLKIDFLKIDGSFVRSIVHDPTDRVMVESINQIGHNLGIETVAEWVSDEDIFDIIKDIGVDYAQGYHVHKPEPLLKQDAGKPAVLHLVQGKKSG